ncbi:MAG: ROK family protein, partial [Clostridiales bacterium]|jgi:glucokinase|nr:ROK family protein [Clostridiales bacterium]
MVRIGFDVGGTKIALGAVNEENRIIARREVPFPTGKSYKEVAKAMADLVKEFPYQIDSIGICIPGDIDYEKGIIIRAHNLQFYKVPFKDEIQDHFPNIPVYLENDANAAALAELKLGAFRNCNTAILLTLGTGVGGGIILDGKLFNGGMNHGVEIGHMCLELKGPLCTCGNKGCIEALCSASWIIREGRKAVIEYPLSKIYTKIKGNIDRVDAKLVIDCAREKDPVATDIFNRYLDNLSSAIASLTAIFDPEVIALGGGVSKAGDFLFEPLRQLVKEKSYFEHLYKIVPAEFGNDAGIIGSAMLGDL